MSLNQILVIHAGAQWLRFSRSSFEFFFSEQRIKLGFNAISFTKLTNSFINYTEVEQCERAQSTIG